MHMYVLFCFGVFSFQCHTAVHRRYVVLFFFTLLCVQNILVLTGWFVTEFLLALLTNQTA